MWILESPATALRGLYQFFFWFFLSYLTLDYAVVLNLTLCQSVWGHMDFIHLFIQDVTEANLQHSFRTFSTVRFIPNLGIDLLQICLWSCLPKHTTKPRLPLMAYCFQPRNKVQAISAPRSSETFRS